MAVIAPKRQWTIKPHAGVQLDRSHPFAIGLQGAWLFNEGGGLGAINLVTSEVGVLTNGPVWQNGALHFDGTNDYVQARAAITIGGNANFTVMARIRTTTLNANGQPIYCERGSSGNDILKFEGPASGAHPGFFITFRNDGGTLKQVFGTTDVHDGAWHTGAVRKVGTTDISVWVDGHLDVASTTAAADTFTNATNETWLGRDKGDSSATFNGDMDFVYCWNRALSDMEIGALTIQPYQLFALPRRMWFAPTAAASTVKFRKTLSGIGTRAGSRQLQGS